MHASRVIAAFVLGILVIIGIGVASVTWTNKPAPSPAVSLVADVTPRGWVPVDFGNGQLSVPASWTITYDTECQTPVRPDEILVGAASSANCPPTSSNQPLVALTQLPATHRGGYAKNGYHAAEINSITVWQRADFVGTGTLFTVLVPQLRLVVSAIGPGVDRIVSTLTYAPAAEALANGPAPLAPSAWKWVTAGELKVAVPGDWPTTTTTGQGPPCDFNQLPGPNQVLTALGPKQVLIDTDTDSEAPQCAAIIGQLVNPPVDGLVIDLHSNPASSWPPNQSLTGRCTSRNGLTLCPYGRSLAPGHDQNAEIDILFAQVTVQSTGRRYMVEIGLAGNGILARTILYSLRAVTLQFLPANPWIDLPTRPPYVLAHK